MTITLEQLTSIIQSPEAKALPVSASMSESGIPWWDHIDGVVHRATEADLMTVALYARLVLETYPGLVESIESTWSVEQNGEELYTDNYLTINGKYYHPDSQSVDDELIDKLAQVDDLEALRVLHASAEGALGSRQMSSETMTRAAALFQKITCVEDVDKIIARIDPDIRAFYEQKIMQLQTPSAPGSKSMGRM